MYRELRNECSCQVLKGRDGFGMHSHIPLSCNASESEMKGSAFGCIRKFVQLHETLVGFQVLCQVKVPSYDFMSGKQNLLGSPTTSSSTESLLGLNLLGILTLISSFELVYLVLQCSHHRIIHTNSLSSILLVLVEYSTQIWLPSVSLAGSLCESLTLRCL